MFEAATGKELDSAFSLMARQRMEALLVLQHGMFYVNRVHLAELAIRARLPSMFGGTDMVEAGGLLQYSPSSTDNYRRAATFVDKILKGAKPADLPVQQPTKFDFIINLKTAKALGLTIPPSLLLRADQVIPAD